MWEISAFSQITGFLYALCLGAVFSIIHDILKAVNKAVKITAIYIFIEDILFFSFAAFITFCFFLVTTGGEIRAYILTGIFIGYALYAVTLSKIIFPVIYKFFIIIKKVKRKVTGWLRPIFTAISGYFSLNFSKILKKIKNGLNSLKKGLKKP